MKRILFFFLITLVLSTFSCSNDFDVTTDWKDIPVVYSLLNSDDPVHYVRLEKAFLDPKANALELARNPDSLYYSNAVVQFERVSNGQFYNLAKIDGNLEGLPRKEGVFAESPNWIYKIDSIAMPLSPGEEIKLHIQRGDNKPDLSAKTVILNSPRLKIPNAAGGTFRFDYDRPTKLTWEADPNIKIFDVKLVVWYAEYDANNPTGVEEKSIVWNWGRGIRNPEGASNVTLEKTGIEFYQLLQSNLTASSNIKRLFQGIDVVITGGGEALEKYINVSLANTGITGSQELPSYSNLSEGRGVFSSRTETVAEKLLLNPVTWDLLRNGKYTEGLNF